MTSFVFPFVYEETAGRKHFLTVCVEVSCTKKALDDWVDANPSFRKMFHVDEAERIAAIVTDNPSSRLASYRLFFPRSTKEESNYHDELLRRGGRSASLAIVLTLIATTLALFSPFENLERVWVTGQLGGKRLQRIEPVLNFTEKLEAFIASGDPLFLCPRDNWRELVRSRSELLGKLPRPISIRQLLKMTQMEASWRSQVVLLAPGDMPELLRSVFRPISVSFTTRMATARKQFGRVTLLAVLGALPLCILATFLLRAQWRAHAWHTSGSARRAYATSAAIVPAVSWDMVSEPTATTCAGPQCHWIEFFQPSATQLPICGKSTRFALLSGSTTADSDYIVWQARRLKLVATDWIWIKTKPRTGCRDELVELGLARVDSKCGSREVHIDLNGEGTDDFRAFLPEPWCTNIVSNKPIELEILARHTFIPAGYRNGLIAFKDGDYSVWVVTRTNSMLRNSTGSFQFDRDWRGYETPRDSEGIRADVAFRYIGIDLRTDEMVLIPYVIQTRQECRLQHDRRTANCWFGACLEKGRYYLCVDSTTAPTHIEGLFDKHWPYAGGPTLPMLLWADYGEASSPEWKAIAPLRWPIWLVPGSGR